MELRGCRDQGYLADVGLPLRLFVFQRILGGGTGWENSVWGYRGDGWMNGWGDKELEGVEEQNVQLEGWKEA